MFTKVTFVFSKTPMIVLTKTVLNDDIGWICRQFSEVNECEVLALADGVVKARWPTSYVKEINDVAVQEKT